MNYWLMKSEPNAFSIDDLAKMPQQTEHWDGVRNYQARNMLRDALQVGDQVFFYHSNCAIPGIVGVSKYFDPQSHPDKPRWFMVDVKYLRHTRRVIPLAELKQLPALENMPLVRKGNRLSIMPVSKQEWDFIHQIEG